MECNVEIPPDACLRQGNGIVELEIPTFNLLVLWQPMVDHLGAGTRTFLRVTLGAVLNRVLVSCHGGIPDISLASRQALDAFQRCIYSNLHDRLNFRPRVVAILPRAMIGSSNPHGYVLVEDFTQPGFRVFIILLPF